MNQFRRSACFALLGFALSLPALAAPAAPAKKPLPVVRALPIAPMSREVENADLFGQSVFQVLLAEIASQRGDLDLASKAYADLARRTRDAKIVERAIEVAGQAKRLDLAGEMARLWVEVEPTSIRAQQLLVSVLALSNRMDDLAPQLIAMLEMDKSTLPENLLALNRMFARNADRQAVFNLIDKVCQPFFGIAEAHYAVAMAASSAGVYERALAEAKQSLELRPEWEMAALLEAQLLSRESQTAAINFLQNYLARYPNARDVQFNLARALIGEKRYPEARQHLDQLLKDAPDRLDVVYAGALLALQEEDKVTADRLLKRLLELDFQDKSLVYFYLGQLAENSKRSDEALAYYAQVDVGGQYLLARFRSAHVLADKGQLDAARKQLSEAKVATAAEKNQMLIGEAGLLREAKQTQAAFDLLDQALATQPDQAELLYETALLAERLGRYEVLESRLRKLIALAPDSAQAYNALGYSFAERNINLPEAQLLIEKALMLAPDDPFILDSLGWVLFRQGDLSGALSNLERSYAKRDDPEVAAHLGEVLWMLGRQSDAARTWRDAQKKYPGNESVAEAIKKFAP